MSDSLGLDNLYDQEPKYSVSSNAAKTAMESINARTNYNLTNLNLGGAPAYIPEHYTNFTKYLGEEIHPFTDMEEERAQAQGVAERWGYAALKFVPGVAAKTLQSIGGILGAIPAAISGDITMMTDNAIASLGHGLEEQMDESLPIHHRRYFTQGNFLEKLGTTEFWADDAMDGLEFFTSAFLVSRGVSAAVRGAVPDKLLGNFAKINNVKKTELAQNVLKNGRPTNIEGWIYNTEFGLTTVLNTLGEAGIEAYHLREELLDEGMGFDEANKAASMAAQGNILALMLSNAWQSRLFLGAGPTNQAASLKNMYKTGADKLGKEATNDISKTLQVGAERLKASFGKEFAKQAPVSIATEGLWEENIQEAMQIALKKAAHNDPEFLNNSIFDYVPALAEQMARNLTETQGRSAIFLGGLLGMFGAGGSAFRDAKSKNEGMRDVIEAYNQATTFGDMNLNSIFALDKDGKPVLNENGDPQINYDNVIKLMSQIFSDKTLFDSAAAELLKETNTGFDIISQLILARDFFKYTEDDASLEFYNAVSDLKAQVKNDEEKTPMEIFLEKHQTKLFELAQIVRAQTAIEGVDPSVNNNLGKALFFEGAKQFIIQDMLATESAKAVNTGTPLDNEINERVASRVSFLNTMLEDSKNMFSMLTDRKQIVELDKKGAFENKQLRIYQKELANLRERYNSSENVEEKKNLQKQIDEQERKVKYTAYLDAHKYGFMYGQDSENKTTVLPKAPIPLDIAREEAFRVMDGRSIAERASIVIGESIENRSKIKELLDTAKNRELKPYERLKAINSLLSLLKQFDDTSSIYGTVGQSLFQQIREIIAIQDELIKALQDEANKLLSAYGTLLEEGILPVHESEMGNEVLSQTTGYSMTAEGPQLTNEDAQREFQAFTGTDAGERLSSLQPNEVTGKMVGEFFLNVKDALESNAGMQQEQRNQTEGIIDNFLENFNKNSEIKDLLAKLPTGGIYEFDNYFTKLIGDADIESLKQKLGDYLDERQIKNPEQAEKDLEHIKGAVTFYEDRIKQDIYDKDDAKRLLKEYKDLIKQYEEAIVQLRENLKKKGRKLEQIKQNEANEKWNALGRDREGKIIDKELDVWLNDNLNVYKELMEKAEADQWNPIYAEYVVQLLISENKNKEYAELVLSKLKASSNNVLDALEKIANDGGVLMAYRNTTSTSSKSYPQNPRLSLYQLLKNSVIFEQVHTLDDSPNVGKFLISNDVTDLEIDGVDKILKPVIDSHLKTLAYSSAVDALSTPINLLNRVKKEIGLMNGLAETQFAPTPGQVAAIRAFYTFLNAKNKKGPFGNAAILGGTTGGGKSKVFSTWSLLLQGIDETEVFALGHTINSTKNINKQVGGRNSKDNLHIENFLPKNHSVGILSDEGAKSLAERLPEGLKIFILDEAMSLSGQSLFNVSLIIDQYNQLHNSDTKFLLMGDPTQLTSNMYDGVTDLFSRYNLFKKANRLNEFRNAARNVKVMPYLSINYRSNIYATAALQSKYVGRVDLPLNIELLASESYLRDNNQVVGAQMAQNEQDIIETIKFQMGNGRTKLLVVANTAEADRMAGVLDVELKNTMTVGSEEVFELTIMTALDAQGEERNEVYINITPDSHVNSVVNPQSRSLVRRSSRKDNNGKIIPFVSYQDYNTLMYTMIGRTTDYVVILPYVQSKGKITPVLDQGAKAEVTEFAIANEENKKEYSNRIKEEKRILEDLTGKKEEPVKEQEPVKEKPEEKDDTVVRDEEVEQDETKAKTKAEVKGKHVKQKQQVVVSKDDIKKNKQKTRDQEAQDDIKNEEERDDSKFNDDALVDNENNDQTATEQLPPKENVEVPERSYEMNIAHPKSANLKPMRIGNTDKTRSYVSNGTEVYFAKVKADNKYGFAIRVYAIADYSLENKTREDYSYVEIGEISGEQYTSEYGQHIDSQITEQANPLPVQGGRFLRIKRGTLIPGIVTNVQPISFEYSENPRNEDPKVSIKETVDNVVNSLFAKEPGFDKDKVTVDFTIIKDRNPKAINAIFDRLGLRPQSGAVYALIGHDETVFPVRLSNLPLTKDHLDVQIIDGFIRTAEHLINEFSPYIENFDIGTREFSGVINAVKEGFVINPEDLSFSWVSDVNVNWAQVEKLSIPPEIFNKNLRTIRNLIYKTYDVEQRLFTIESDKFEAWRKEQSNPDNFTLGEQVGKGNRYYIQSVKDERDEPGYVTTYNLTNKRSPLMIALKDLVKTNQFANEKNDARQEIKNVRYEVEKRAHNHKLHGASRMQAKNPFYSGEYNRKYFDFIEQKLIRLQEKYNDLMDTDLIDVNLETYEGYLEKLREYQQKHPDREDVANSLNDLEKQKGNRENHKQMTLQDLKNFLQFNQDGVSDFGDGQYLRAPVKTSYDLNINNAHKFVTSKLQKVNGTQLRVASKSDTSVQPSAASDVQTAPPKSPKRKKGNRFGKSGPKSRNYVGENTGKVISVQQAKDIAKRIIPGISESQIEFIELALLQNRRNYKESETLLGQMRGKAIALGLVPGTEVQEGVYEKVLHHELMHLLWNHYIKPSEKQAIINQLHTAYPQTREMNHIEIDEFISENFQDYTKKDQAVSFLRSLFDRIINWLNLLINEKKSLDLLFQEIHEGKFNANVDYASKQYKDLIEKTARKIENKLNELEREDMIKKKCHTMGGGMRRGGRNSTIMAKNGLSNGLSRGGSWKVLKRFKGASHEQGGIDILINQKGVKMGGKQGVIKAQDGLMIASASMGKD